MRPPATAGVTGRSATPPAFAIIAPVAAARSSGLATMPRMASGA